MAESLESVERIAVVGPVNEIEQTVVDIGPADIIIVAVGADRGQLGPAEVIDGFCRQAPVLDVRTEAAVRRNRHLAFERLILDRVRVERQRLDDLPDRRRRREHRPAAVHKVLRLQIGSGAAFLVALGIVADQANRKILGRLVKQLAANQPAVAVVDPAARDDVLQKAVALDHHSVHPERERLADRPGRTQFEAAEVVIADGGLAIDPKDELGSSGDYRNQAGRGVAPEQRALRTAQHFDPLDLAELGQANRGARAIDAVDEQRDRAFEPGVVADRSDAADPGGRSAGFGLGGGNEQRGRDLLQLLDVARTGVFQLLGGDRADRKRNVGEGFVAASRGDDDVTRVPGRVGGCLIVDRGGLDGCTVGRLSAALVGVGLLSERRRRDCEQAGRNQPDGFAHDSPPKNLLGRTLVQEKASWEAMRSVLQPQ